MTMEVDTQMLKLYWWQLQEDDSRNAMLLKDALGLNEHRVVFSRDELAEKYDLAKERVRQLLLRPYGSRNLSPTFLKKLKDYVGLSSHILVLCSEDENVKLMQQSNCPELSVKETLHLIQTIDRGVELVSLPNGIEFVISGPDRYGAHILRNYGWIDKWLGKTRNDVMHINLCVGLPYRSSEDKEVLNALSVIFERTFKGNEYFVNHGELQFALRPNKVNRAKELYTILEENGMPMKIEEIEAEFYSRFLEEQRVSRICLRNDLSGFDDVIGKGLTGLLYLKSWQPTFTRTITDYLHHTLSSSKTPIALTELTASAKSEFPTTTQRSVETLLLREILRRFVAFKGKTYGIPTKKYHSRYQLTELTRARMAGLQ